MIAVTVAIIVQTSVQAVLSNAKAVQVTSVQAAVIALIVLVITDGVPIVTCVEIVQ